MPDGMPEDMPEHMPEDIPEDMPEHLPEDMPEHLPEDMPGRMPEDMPYRMPDRMPENMSDRMPEDLPVTKCINVMVGITRSKVFFFNNWEFTTIKEGLFPFFGKTCLVNGERFFSVYLLDDHWANNRAAQLNIDFFRQGTVSKVSHGM